jgi:hypothetical protein
MTATATKPLALVFRFLFAGMGELRRQIPANSKPRSQDAAINRWTGKPHEHARTKMRRRMQLAKMSARRDGFYP